MNPALKAALWTAFFSFVTLFGTSLIGWLQDVVDWASDDSAGIVFPDPGVLAKAGVSAVVSAMIGLVNFLVRFGQQKAGVGEVPVYVKPPQP